MNAKLLVLLWAVFFLLCPQTTKAHFSGLPFVKINGKDEVAYPIPSASTTDYPLPQDIGAENYLVNQSLFFELDTKVLPAPPEVINKTVFSWDFADGIKGTGTSISHKYAKAGSFVIIVYAKDDTIPTPQVVDTILVNIVPSVDYKLPKAIIKIDGKQKDTLYNSDHVLAGFDKTIRFDASSSTQGSAPIVKYFWDFGDGTSATSTKADHKYPEDLSVVFPVLRVTDENGFFSDSYLWLDNGLLKKEDSSTTSAKTKEVKKEGFNPLMIIIPGLILVTIIGVVIFQKRSNPE